MKPDPIFRPDRRSGPVGATRRASGLGWPAVGASPAPIVLVRRREDAAFRSVHGPDFLVIRGWRALFGRIPIGPGEVSIELGEISTGPGRNPSGTEPPPRSVRPGCAWRDVDIICRTGENHASACSLAGPPSASPLFVRAGAGSATQGCRPGGVEAGIRSAPDAHGARRSAQLRASMNRSTSHPLPRRRSVSSAR